MDRQIITFTRSFVSTRKSIKKFNKIGLENAYITIQILRI